MEGTSIDGCTLSLCLLHVEVTPFVNSPIHDTCTQASFAEGGTGVFVPTLLRLMDQLAQEGRRPPQAPPQQPPLAGGYEQPPLMGGQVRS